MRVLQFLWRLSPEGGIPRVVRDLATGLDADDLDLHICTARPLVAEDDLGEIRARATLHSLSAVGTPGRATRARMALRLATLTRHLRPDVLHVHSGTSWYATAAAPLVPRSGRLLEVHDTPQSGRYSAGNAKSMQALIDRFGFQVVTHSSSVGNDLHASWGLPADQMSCIPIAIPSGSEVSGADRSSARVRLGFGPRDQIVLYVARLVDSKRPGLFIDVAEAVLRSHPATQFVLVGGGPHLGALRSRVAASDLSANVHVTGRVESLDDYYRAATMFLSTSAYEGFGIALGEALVTGVPVITTNVGGVRDVVAHGRTGLVIDASSPEPLAKAVVDLLDDEITRRRFAVAGRQDALERFSLDRMVSSYEALYRTCVPRELAVTP